MKIGDKVPKEDYEYYIVEKIFVKDEKTKKYIAANLPKIN